MPPHRAGMEPPGYLPHAASQTVELLTLEPSSTSEEPKTGQDEGSQTDERCPVCGDKVSGYHYGLLTCESCKGFFKRSVQNNKKYTCSEQQRCPINLSQRKRCPSCRFQKCLAVGMKQEAVRADRMRGGRNKFGPLYRRDRQLKQQRGFHHSNSAPYRIKTETHPMHQHQLPPAPASGFHLLGVAAGASASHQSHVYSPSGAAQPDTPSPLDCSGNTERVLSPPPQLCHGLYPRAFLPAPLSSGYLQDREVAFGCSGSSAAAAVNYPLHATPSHLFTQRSSPAESPSPSANHMLTSPLLHEPAASPPCTLPGSFLGRLLEGEQDESQLCAKVVACLQREQANRGKHDRLNTFSIMCKVADQTLFGLVEWARNSALFKELKVEDQMVLLQSCWSELLVLDHLCRQVTYGKEGCIYLVTGQQIEVSTIMSQAGATLSGLVSRTQDLVSKLKALHFDRHEFVCLKYLVLFNPDVKSVLNRRQVEQTQERVNRALMEHTQRSHPGHSDKFGQLLLRLPEVRSISLQVEEYLYQRHLLGDLPCNSLLTEMLHTKHS